MLISTANATRGEHEGPHEGRYVAPFSLERKKALAGIFDGDCMIAAGPGDTSRAYLLIPMFSHRLGHDLLGNSISTP
jgi:hypothetical protein